jgi:hypothetical protein
MTRWRAVSVQACGDVIGYLNAGDILHPHALDVLAEVFANPGVDWVTGYTTQINDRLQLTSASRPTRYRREFVDNGFYADDRFPFCIQQESTFWSNRLNRSVDLERLRTFKLAGDYFLWTQFARVGRTPFDQLTSRSFQNPSRPTQRKHGGLSERSRGDHPTADPERAFHRLVGDALQSDIAKSALGIHPGTIPGPDFRFQSPDTNVGVEMKAAR